MEVYETCMGTALGLQNPMSRRVIIGLPKWHLNVVCSVAASLVRGLRGQGEDARLLLTEEHTPLVNVPPTGPPLPADVPADRIRVTAHDRWSEAWIAIERYLEEQAPCVWVTIDDFRSTCISRRLSSRIRIVGVLHDDSAIQYEHAARQGRAWDAVVAVNPQIHHRAASSMSWLADKLVTIPIGQGDGDTMVERWRELFAQLENRRHPTRRRRLMSLPPQTLGGVSILSGKLGCYPWIANRVPFWPDPRILERPERVHDSHCAPLRDHRIVLAATTGRISGVDIFSVHLVRALAARGVRAEILVTLPHEKVPDPLPIPEGVAVRNLPVTPRYSWRRRWKILRQVLTEDGPCIYIPNYDYQHSGVCGTLPGSVKVLGIVHSDDPWHYAHCVRLGATWNGVVAVSQTIAREVTALAPDLGERLHVIPYGVELPPLPERQGRPPGTPLRLFYAGRLIRYQKRALDLPCILDALAARGVPVELTVAGNGPDEQDFLKGSERFIANGQMRYVGGVANEQVAALMSRSDVFVLPSAFEGLPVALLEAMAHGLVPVAAHCRSGVDEVIQPEANGFLVPVGDVDAFADRIAQLSANPEMLARMSQAARRTIEAGRFTVDAMADSYLELMEKVASEPFSRPIVRILPPDQLRGLRSWLPPQLPRPLQAMGHARNALRQMVPELLSRLVN
jgi:glycosyltransferase involved in cell wall biosynthesis